MKEMNFQDDVPSIPIDDFKNQYVVVFDLTWRQDANKNCHYPEAIAEAIRLELNFSHLLQNFTEPIVLGERMWSVVVCSWQLGIVRKNA